MNRHIIISRALAIAVGIVTLSFASCDNVDEEFNNGTVKGFDYVTFIPATTRASDNYFEAGDAIGVYASTNERGEILASGNYASNEKYSFSAGEFIQVGKGIQKYKGEGTFAINYYAVYPYNEQQRVSFTFTINEDQSTHSNYTRNDLMMGYNAATTAETLVPLKFRHMLAQVVVNTAHTDLEGRNVSLVFLSDINKVVANLAKLTAIRAESNTKPIDIIMCPDGLNQYKAVLPPQQMIAKEVVVYLRYDGRTKLARLENSINLHSGKSVYFELYPVADSDEYILRQVNIQN